MTFGLVLRCNFFVHFQSFAANGNAEDSYDNGYDFGSMPKYAGQYGGIAESFTNMAEVKPDTDTGKPRILLMGLRRWVEISTKLKLYVFDFYSSVQLPKSAENFTQKL